MHPLVTTPGNIRVITGVLSRTRAYQLEKSDPDFPRRVRIGNSTGWLTNELQSYLITKAEGQTAADAKQTT